MESKKLKTSLDPVGILVVEEGENYVGRLLDASVNDARIAHEQRDVIRKLDAQVAALANWVNARDCNPAVNHLLMRARETRAAAAPYLQED